VTRELKLSDPPPTTGTSEIQRYQEGWRSGKPVEDPEKLKRWGHVGAKPSEYLVCTHRGQVDRRRSGSPRSSTAALAQTSSADDADA
jgi:hypothetical protein